MKKILVIAPHPDDEVLGCGGTIARHVKSGDEVYLLVVTKTYQPEWSAAFIKNRPKEIARSNAILGIKKTFFLDYPTVQLDTIPQRKLNGAFGKIIKDIQPEILYIPHVGDLNRDHRLVFEAALVAARPIHSTVQKILSYEVLSETEWGQPLGIFIPNFYVDVDAQFAKKISAMKAYRSELKKFPHPRSLVAIKALAQKRGSECGVSLAEAFMVIREVIS